MLGLARPPAATLDDDAGRVHAAARLLRIPDFAFFRLAYRRWYGDEPDDRTIEPFFMLYLFRGRVPPWVRHLARDVVDRESQGELRPETYGVVPVLPPPPTGSRIPSLILGVFYAACFIVFTLAAL